MLSRTINVGILDHHTIFRKVLENYLSGLKNLNVIIQSNDVVDLLGKFKRTPVHILLMDILIPKPGGVNSVKIIKEKFPETRILILTMCTDMELLSDLLDAGVYGMLSKSDEPEELIHAIESVSEEKICRSKLLTEVMYWNRQTNINQHIEPSNVTLTEREKEILQLLWEEKSNKEIASHLYLSVRSIEKTRQDMKEKIGVKSTVGLLKYAINNKIIAVNSFYNNDYLINPA